MSDRFISLALSQRLFVLVAMVVLGVFGVQAFKALPIDAFPEVSPIQAKIILKAEGMTPLEMEQQITAPIEMEMQGIPGQRIVRSLSKYGIADITIDFEDDVDIYWARQQVNERLQGVMERLPSHVKGGLAPITTPLGEILMFTLDSPSLSLLERREILDWVIRPRLKSIEGVADVNSLGGFAKGFIIEPNSEVMLRHGVRFSALEEAIVKHHQNAGMGRLRSGEEALLVRFDHRASTLEQIRDIIVSNHNERILRIGDLAEVTVDGLVRNGFVTKDGEEETVQGIVLSLRGADASSIVRDVKEILKELEPSLPQDLSVTIFYDRSDLIQRAIDTITSALLEATVLVIVLLLLFLGSGSAALSAALILPLSILAAFILMGYFNLSANIMSLGGLAIAVGILVDSAVVVVENITERLSRNTAKDQSRLHLIYEATREVSTPIISGIAIIIIVFTPLLGLEGLEGKLFSPVALTIVFALISALILTLSAIPVISSFLIRNPTHETPWIMEELQNLYRALLTRALRYPKTVMGVALLALLASLIALPYVGKTFMPEMDEGNIIVGVEKIPSTSIEASREFDLVIQRRLMERIPEIISIVGRTGTDELGLDPMSLNDTDTFMVFKPKSQWRTPSTEWMKAQIREVFKELQGVEYGFTMPIKMRVDEMLTGTRGDVAIKVFGNDTSTLERLANEIETVVSGVSGAQDVFKRQGEGVEYLEVVFDDAMLSRLGLSAKEVGDILSIYLQGREISTVQQGLRRFPMMLRGDKRYRDSESRLHNLTILNSAGEQVRLDQVVQFKKRAGAVMIEHENAMRMRIVQASVEGRDLSGFVKEAKTLVAQRVAMPAGYYATWGGEFENQERAFERLGVIVPIALGVIFLLLFITFNHLGQAFLVMLNVPFALIGGIFGLLLTGEYLSVPASVGFIALLGIAILNGIVLINYFNTLKSRGVEGVELIMQGALRRLRPVMMTALIAALGLIPLLFADGPGSEIQRPLAIVVISGLITSTLLTLLLLPILYHRFFTKKALDTH